MSLSCPIFLQRTFRNKTEKMTVSWNAALTMRPERLGAFKKIFYNLMFSQVRKIKPIPEDCKIYFVYTAYFPDKLTRDVNNYCGLVDKFLQDYLVKVGKFKRDDYKSNQITIFKFGGFDKTNPRVECEIYIRRI